MGGPEVARQARQRTALVSALKLAAAGEPSGLRRVYEMTSAKLFGICLRICGDREAAEDVLQDVYVKVWRRAAAFDELRASPISWLAAITRNAAVDWRRSEYRHEVVPGEGHFATIADDTPTADIALEDSEARARLEACLGGLHDHEATAIRQAFLEGFTYQQLSDRMDTPLGTIKSWIRRGLIKLKGCLGDG